MALIKDGKLVDDIYTHVGDEDSLPANGAVLVSLKRWQSDRETLLERTDPLGVKLKSDESPESISADLNRLSLVALEFPVFRDGRAYSYARLLRDRFAFAGEVRAVGEVLMEQLHFMLRTGFDAFDLNSENPLQQYETAMRDFSVWYQPAADGRPTAIQLRHSGRG